MRILKLFVISAVVLFCLITAISLLIPAHIRISKAINIQAAPGAVLALVRNKNAWPQWHPAFAKQNADSFLRAQHITTILQADTDSLVQYQWQQGRRTPVVNSWQLHRFATTDSVALQWYMDFKLQWYPWQKFSSLFYEPTYGVMMERGLQNIKTLAQQTP